MKKLLTVLSLFAALQVQAQKNTLLESSFWQDKPEVAAVKAEADKGNSPSQFNQMSMDPVVMAINAQAPAATILYLVDQPGNEVSKLTHDGRTYLHWAAARGNTMVVEYLLKKGSKVNVLDSHGTTPLLFAAGSGQPDTRIYDLLIAHGADIKKEVNQEGANALLLAITNDKDLKLTDYFVSKGLSLNSTDAAGNNAFSYAARAGNIELLKTLVQKGVKPNPNAMLMAAQGGNRRGSTGATLDLYQYLESLNLKPAVKGKGGENALHYLVRRPGQTDIIRYFIGKGADVNQTDEAGNTVFMTAAAGSRDTAVLAMLLPYVKNIDQPNQKGVTALAMAVRSNSPEVVSYLIGKGASVNVLDSKGNNLAYYLMESYRPQGNRPGGQAPGEDAFGAKLTMLQQKGLNVAAPQKDGNTLYHLAVAKNDIALLKRLEPLHIDVNARNSEGLTALHKAAMIGKDDAVMKYLIAAGAKKDVVTNYKETAFDLASENESLSKSNVSVTFLK